MKDFELDAKLKSIPVPERSEEYWDDFPAQVRINLRRPRREPAARTFGRPRLAWAGGFVLAMVVGILCVRFHPLEASSQAISRHETHLRTQLAQLNAGLHVLMFNPHGMGYLLTDTN